MAKAIQAEIPDCHAKWLMVILADHANEDTHQCWPSLDRLAKRSCMDKSTVTRKLKWLEANGWLTRERGNNRRSTLYTIFPLVAESNSTVAQCNSTGAESNTKLSVTSQENKIKRKRQIPDDWFPDSNLCNSINSIMKEEIDHDFEANQFRDFHQSKGNSFADISKAYRNWIRNTVKWRKERAGTGSSDGGGKSSRGRHQSSYFSGVIDEISG